MSDRTTGFRRLPEEPVQMRPCLCGPSPSPTETWLYRDLKLENVLVTGDSRNGIRSKAMAALADGESQPQCAFGR
jgi:hypothetical protein